ncbi:MAG: thymidine kinase [Sediminibacterium sp.]|nr:thymidine kinase [Sediminibacterium sp.]
MFIEATFPANKAGCLEVICGSMFSGKTEELIRRIKRVQIAQIPVQLFKISFDHRYNKEKVVSHDAQSISSTVVDKSLDILHLSKDAVVVGIDEIQFFDENIVDVIETLLKNDKRVIVAGLDMDFTGKPFKHVPYLLAIADFITKLHAICTVCGGLAHISYRKNIRENTLNQVVIGTTDIYEARCRKCAIYNNI